MNVSFVLSMLCISFPKERNTVMDEAKKKRIIEQATMCLKVLSQVPMIEDDEARAAANLVWKHCRANACTDPDEKKVWDDVFHGMMPLNSYDAKKFMAEFNGDDKNEA